MKDRDLLHGAALLQVIEDDGHVAFTYESGIHNSLYLVEKKGQSAAVLLKLTTKPRPTWPFAFTEQEGIALRFFRESNFGIRLFFALVCHKDGVCCLSEEQFFRLLEDDEIAGKRVSVSRPHRGSYRVNGPGRNRLEETIPRSRWPGILFQGR